MKTGFIKEAGYGIVASAKQDNRRLILVINGLDRAEDRKERGDATARVGLQELRGIQAVQCRRGGGPGSRLGRQPMWVGSIGGDGDISVMLPRYPANQKLKAEIIYKGPLKTPIKKGDRVGVLRVTSRSQAVNEVPLYRRRRRRRRRSMVRRGLDTLFHMAFRWVL